MLRTKVIYAVEILRAIDSTPGIRVQDIADEVNISISYVEEHITPLRDHGYVVGKRGHGGGYKLADGVVFPDIIIQSLAEAIGANKTRSLRYTTKAELMTIKEILRV